MNVAATSLQNQGHCSDGAMRAQAFSFEVKGCSLVLPMNHVFESYGSVARLPQNARLCSRVR